MASNRNPDITEQVESFMLGLDAAPAQPMRAIFDAVEYLLDEGVGARRPVWAPIVLLPDYPAEFVLFGNRLHELRPLGTTVRILAIWSPDGVLAMLYAGDKEGDWNRWYRRAIPAAADGYRELAQVFGWKP